MDATKGNVDLVRRDELLERGVDHHRIIQEPWVEVAFLVLEDGGNRGRETSRHFHSEIVKVRSCRPEIHKRIEANRLGHANDEFANTSSIDSVPALKLFMA